VRFTAFVIILLAGSAQATLAQRAPVSAPCTDFGPLLSASDRAYCHAIAQTVHSAQPLLGILSDQGEPAPGVSRLHAGFDGPSRVDAGFRIGAVQVRLPAVGRRETSLTQQIEHTTSALDGALSLPLFQGVSAAGMSGIGSVRAIAAATWLPFGLIRLDGLAEDAARFVWGAGAIVGVVGESNVLPAVALSVMHRRLGRVSYGEVCPAGAGADILGGSGSGYDFMAGMCAAPVDPAELSFNLSSLSTRAIIGKRLGAFAMAAGGGYTRHGSNVDFGLGANAVIPGLGERPVYVRASGLRLEQARWSGFATGSLALGRAGVTAEAGWLQGGSVVEGFDAASSAFDPERGTLFGSLGVRVAF
jgi:hypothetical protein